MGRDRKAALWGLRKSQARTATVPATLIGGDEVGKNWTMNTHESFVKLKLTPCLVPFLTCADPRVEVIGAVASACSPCSVFRTSFVFGL